MPDAGFDQRLTTLQERLRGFAEVEEHLGITLERPVRSLIDGYPETTITHSARIVEGILKHVWLTTGIKGDPSRKTLQDLMNGCSNYLRDRNVQDHIRSIQLARNRAAHHGGEVVDEDAFDALRRLVDVLKWFTVSFGPFKESEEEVLSETVKTQLRFVSGLYHVLGFELVERRSLSARSAYLLLQRTKGIRTNYAELILSEDIAELAAIASQRSQPLFQTQYPTASRLVAVGPGRLRRRELPAVLEEVEVLSFDELLGQFLHYPTYRRATEGAQRPAEVDLPATGQLLRLDPATHDFSVQAVEDAQLLLRDEFLSGGGNLLLIGKPGSGKSEQLRRLFHAAVRDEPGRFAFKFDLGSKPRGSRMEEYLSACLASHFTVDRHLVFPLFAYLSRSGRVLNIFDGIDEACGQGDFHEFMEVFAAIAELLSVESWVVMSSRIAFLEDSPYVRQLLNREALISDRVVNDVTAFGIDPLKLPNFSVLRLTDVELQTKGAGEERPIGTPLEQVIMSQVDPERAGSARQRPAHQRQPELIRALVEQAAADASIDVARLAAFFGSAFLKGQESFRILELLKGVGPDLFDGEIDADTALPVLLHPIGPEHVRFRHRLFQEFLAAMYLVDAIGDLGAPVNLTEQVRSFFHHLSEVQTRDDGVVEQGIYIVGPADRLRLHFVRHPFRIEKDPVTAGEYGEFLEAAQRGELTPFEHPSQPMDVDHRPPPWRLRNPDVLKRREFDDQPISCVTWWSAHAYARWRGGRLLTAVEWECAARGRDGRLFPWGDEPDISKANSADYWAGTELLGYDAWKSAMDRGAVARATTTGVASFPDNVSPVGARGMVGNVWEWTRSLSGESSAVICGGSYDNPLRGVRTYSKGVYRRDGMSNVVGFRWGKDL